MKDIIAVGLFANIFLAIVCGSILVEQGNKYEYKLGALQATQGCEACQMLILSKGRS